jgi:hypothetical protein
MAQDSPAEEQQ